MAAKTRTVIRDPVHGDIPLSAEELRILDTPEMQRLRGVRQLGTAYLVYPGAQHTRFEHSLGTMHVAQRLVDAVNRNRAAAPGALIGVADDEARILRAAALVHDITHIPYGHSIEDQSGILERHDSPERYFEMLAPVTGIGRVLEQMGIRLEVLAILIPDSPPDSAGAGSTAAETSTGGETATSAAYSTAAPSVAAPASSAVDVAPAVATPTGQLGLADPARPDVPLGAPARPRLPRIPPYWREILSDTICADILDYLARDAYFTGLNLRYDDRVVDLFKVDRQSGHLFVDAAKRGLVREDVLSELVRVLDARYFFSERVYYHHAKVAAGAMVEHVVATALLHGGLDPPSLFRQTDESLWPLLKRHEPLAPEAAARHRELIDRYRSRRLLKRACVFPLYANRDVQDLLIERFFAPGRFAERAGFEAAVRQALRDDGIDPPVVLLYCPARRMQLKEAATHIRFPGDDAVRPMSAHRDRIPRLADLERSYRDLWKLYVLAGTDDPTVLARIGAVVADLLPEATDVYRPKE